MRLFINGFFMETEEAKEETTALDSACQEQPEDERDGVLSLKIIGLETVIEQQEAEIDAMRKDTIPRDYHEQYKTQVESMFYLCDVAEIEKFYERAIVSRQHTRAVDLQYDGEHWVLYVRKTTLSDNPTGKATNHKDLKSAMIYYIVAYASEGSVEARNTARVTRLFEHAQR